ncbi:glycogen debranching protein GlgX [Vibrio coralliilyticus]|uniref:glycogen debranching protein GlgX n=1 Tax=Vibrio coralliilyticus TaxID=190893 RepID=UPI000BAB009B|nr:glycogen debranching protein GlgX [Vibrio coralliilyticus]NOI58026.1 glycogen debranching protein GlgX [Vibrio coralliilyticus]PAT69632.1 glycogen debranching enzyme GlgX [Vibrio coralliilyticus]
MPCSRPYPLGATLNHEGCNFAIYAPKNKDLQLALFDEKNNYQTFSLTNEYAGIKHTFIPGVKAGQRYGFIIGDEDNLQLISDPYAKALDKPLFYETPFNSAKSFDLSKCVVIQNEFDWQGIEKPYRPRDEMVLFETHVKGVSKLNPNVPTQYQGNYLGLVSDAMLAFYKEQQINTLQLLPIAACMHEPHLLKMDKVNYWGYNPYVFMAPDPRYAAQDAVTELKTAIRELHRHGIEVILDVVYNHTAEGDEKGPVFNLKALDDRYYFKYGEHFANFTGCGNTLDLSYQPALNLVMDTLRYWVEEYQIDGFRFDLAATLGREGEDFNPNSGFFKAVAQDPVLKEVKLIAEPWDIGPNGYQVGNFPFGWNECNDRLRDITRSFWRGDQGYLKEFATRLMGSRDLYSAANWPYKLTVNYITYHDGFSMQDLVSYRHKHNEANGEQNRDGHGDNRSDNYGVEGETENPSIIEKREKQKRNFMASLLFAFGIPHILTADVLSHSQKGNNNAYCQDNELSWLNWQPSHEKDEFKTWLANMVKARQTYMVPFIRAFSGENRNDNRIHWRRIDGTFMEHDDWNQLSSVALQLGIGKHGDELFYCINQTNAPARFSLPSENQQQWTMVCNTDNHELHQTIDHKQVLIAPSSMAIFHAKA